MHYDDGISAEIETHEEIEYGLRLPNGRVLWRAYHNRSIVSPHDRAVVVAVLRLTAQEHGFSEEDFLAHYSWVARRVTTTMTTLGLYPVTDPEALTPAGSEDDGL